jgi:peptide deformylase
MAILPIRLADETVLREKTKKVRTIDASIQRLIDDMFETMYDAPGVGLAANQVGVGLRIAVIGIPAGSDGEDDPPETDEYVLINPEIVKRSGERILDEGCLSVPGYKAKVPRSVSVTVKALNREGKEYRIKAKDTLLAEALEHEIDHLNGTLYIDYLESLDELVKLEPRSEEEDEAEEDESQQRTRRAAPRTEAAAASERGG